MRKRVAQEHGGGMRVFTSARLRWPLATPSGVPESVPTRAQKDPM